MKFKRILKEVLWCLLIEGRISYDRIRRDFGLDEAGLEDLRRVLIQAKGCAEHDGAFLVWAPEARRAAVQIGAEPLALHVVEDDHRRPSAPASASTPIALAATSVVNPPAAERRQLTVMFCDLVGSTDLSNRLDPEDLADIIRSYQQAVTPIIHRFGGYVAKYMGDGILVYFGYPQTLEKDAEGAVRTGLAILGVLPALNAEIGRAKAGADLAVRIGIATGLVMVGESVGQGPTAEKAVVGETPNLAARLQSLAGPGSIVINAVTRDLAGDDFVYSDLGAHALKGIAEPVHAWSVSGLAEEDGEGERGNSAPPLLVGRDEEIGLLRRAWQQARDEGRGQVVLVGGEPGIGKSTLIGTLRSSVQAEGLPRLTLRCSPYHTNSALYPIIEHLKRVARWRPEDDAAARLHKLERMLAGYSLPKAESVPLIAHLLSLRVPEARYPPLKLTPQQLKQQTEDALVAFTLEEAERQPLLQVFEDVHWADPSTLELVGLLIEQAPTASLLIVLTFRPEFSPPWPARSHLTPITLNRLERPQIELMATRLAGGKELPQEVLEYVVRKTDGVPLYVEELTKTVLGSGSLREEDAHYALTGPLSGVAIPASLQEVLMARLDRLPMVREVAQLGAVLGREFAYEMLHAIGVLDEPELRSGLGQLVGAELLYQRGRPPRSTYVFKHALIQDAAYQSLLKRTRQQHHQRVAALLEGNFPDIVAEQPELVAHHYGEAGRTEEALEYWHRAAQRAAQRSANPEVIGHARKSLEMLDTLPDTPERAVCELQLQRLLGTALMATKGYTAPETAIVLWRARELCRVVDTDDIYPVLAGVWLLELSAANHLVGQEIAEEMLVRAPAAGNPEPRMIGHVMAGITYLHLGELATAWTHFEEAVSLYEKHQPKALSYRYGLEYGAAGYSYAAWCRWLLGYPDQARRLVDQGAAVLERADHSYTTARGLYWNSVLHQFCREWRVVEEQAERAIGLATEHGFALVIGSGGIMRGAAHSALGGGEDGIRAMRGGLKAYEATGTRFQRPHHLALLAEALRAEGQLDESLTVLDEAMALVEETGERYYEAEIHRLRGTVLLAGGGADATEATASFETAIEVARRQQARPFELRAVCELARLWADQGDPQQARELLLPVYQRDTERFPNAHLVEAKALLDALN